MGVAGNGAGRFGGCSCGEHGVSAISLGMGDSLSCLSTLCGPISGPDVSTLYLI